MPAAGGLRRSSTTNLRGKALAPIAIVVCSMLAGALYTFAMGEDVNWDWQNYHEYNVWAVLNGRYGVDAVPPGFQTYFNPIVYFPVYYLRHYLPSPYGLMIIGAIHGLNLALICLFARVVLRQAATVATIAAAVAIAASGPMTLSEVGTSFSDVLLALPVIGGFLLILAADRQPAVRYLLAGLLIGATVGLKLTNVVYAIGAAAAVLAAARPLRASVLLGLGGIVGAALTGGEWCLIAWRDTGNPIFPLFNAVFQSGEVASVNLMDAQFMPHSVSHALAYPFYWLMGDHRGAEHPFRDARFAVVAVLFVLGLLVRMTRGSAILTRRDVQLVVLFAVSYLAWLGLFSIQRYAVVLELLCGPIIVLLLARLAERGADIAHGVSRSAERVDVDGCSRDRIVVAAGGLVAPPLVRRLPAEDRRRARSARDLLHARQAARLYRAAASAAVALLPARRYRCAHRPRRDLRPAYPRRTEGSAARRSPRIAHARRAGPQRAAGSLRACHRSHQALYRHRGRPPRHCPRKLPADRAGLPVEPDRSSLRAS